MTAGLLPPDIAVYDLLQSGAVWFDAPLRWSSFRGAKAMDVLNGLITNDVTALVTGTTQAAVALTPKGKIVCDMVVLRADTESFFVGVHDLASTSWLDLVRKYVNPRLAVVTDESARYQTWYLLGASAAQVTGALEAADASSMHVPPRILRAPLPATAPAFLILAEHSDATEVLATLSVVEK